MRQASFRDAPSGPDAGCRREKAREGKTGSSIATLIAVLPQVDSGSRGVGASGTDSPDDHKGVRALSSQATRRTPIGRTRWRMYATNVAMPSSSSVITAELISPRNRW